MTRTRPAPHPADPGAVMPYRPNVQPRRAKSARFLSAAIAVAATATLTTALLPTAPAQAAAPYSFDMVRAPERGTQVILDIPVRGH
ncbi:hypothetical protein, partial [Streptomyces sp. NPDC003832]